MYNLTSIIPKVDIVIIQEHKLCGSLMKHIGTTLMPCCTSWVLEAASVKRSWFNSNAADKCGVGIILNPKYANLVTKHGSICDNYCRSK